MKEKIPYYLAIAEWWTQLLRQLIMAYRSMPDYPAPGAYDGGKFKKDRKTYTPPVEVVE